MKKFKSVISVSACAVCALAALPFSAGAADGDTVYGTMNIPYADFYAAEIDNAYQVDAVSSATTNKWSMNTTGSVNENGEWVSGGLVAGTYNDGNGTILGVTFPVSVSAADVDFLKENYGFEALSEAPKAYKEVTVTDGALTVSKVVDTDGEEKASGSVSVTTPTKYGDVQLAVKGYPASADLYGVLFNTSTGESYAARHLENIWRNGSFAWSVGVKTVESHGNTLKADNFKDSQGKTITEVKFITLDGYTVLSDVNAYIPYIYDGKVTVEDSSSGDGSTTFTTSGVPDDAKIAGTVADGFTVDPSGTITYTGAMPGSYTLTISDANGKYGNITGSFTLSTEDIPVKYEDGKLVAADGFSDEDAANFIKNITSVEVNGTAYKTGKRGVTIVDSDGVIDFAAEGSEGAVFDGSGEYSFNITATGYTNPLIFAITSAEETVTTATTASDDTATTTTTTTAKTTTTTAPKTTKAAAGNSPKTGVADAAVPAALLALAGAAAVTFRKKND